MQLQRVEMKIFHVKKNKGNRAAALVLYITIIWDLLKSNRFLLPHLKPS